MSIFGSKIDCLTLFCDLSFEAKMTLIRTKELDAAVVVMKVVPTNEAGAPIAGFVERRESVVQEIWSILASFEKALGEGIVVADMRSAERGLDAEILKLCKHRRSLHGRAVITVQNKGTARDVFRERSFRNQGLSMVSGLVRPDLPADNEAAEDVNNHVEEEKLSFDRAVKIGDIPGPDLIGSMCDMRGRIAVNGRFRAATVMRLIVFLEDAVTGAFRSDIYTTISQDRYDLIRGKISEFRIIQGCEEQSFFVRS